MSKIEIHGPSVQEQKRAEAVLKKLPRGCRMTTTGEISFPLPLIEEELRRMELIRTTAALAQKTLQKLNQRIQSVADDVRAGGFPTQADMIEAISEED